MVGDVNVHKARLLKFSNGESPEGLKLESVCGEHGHQQHVKSPSRGKYLLDLVLSACGSQLCCTVLPQVFESDPLCIIADIDIGTAVSLPCS